MSQSHVVGNIQILRLKNKYEIIKWLMIAHRSLMTTYFEINELLKIFETWVFEIIHSNLKVRISRTTTTQETREETQLKMMAILFCSKPSCFAVERMQSHDEWIFDKKLWQKPTFSLCSRANSVDARSGCNVFHSVGSLQFLLLLFRQFCSFRCRSLFSTRVSLGQYDLCCAASTILPRFKYLWT